MRHTMLIVATMLIAVPVELAAQAAMPIGVRSSSGLHLATPLPDSNKVGRDPDYRKRVRPAVMGGLAGAVALGGIMYMAALGCEGGDKCDGSYIVIIPAALLGGIVGSAYGAAAPRGRGLCTPAQRFGMGMGGAFLGALAGIPVFPVLVATVPMGSVMFMRNC